MVLAMIPKLENSSDLFDSIVSQLKVQENIPENMCSCILANYAYFGRSTDALELLKEMQERGIALRYWIQLSLI